jgi:hypothetical protein
MHFLSYLGVEFMLFVTATDKRARQIIWLTIDPLIAGSG